MMGVEDAMEIPKMWLKFEKKFRAESNDENLPDKILNIKVDTIRQVLYHDYVRLVKDYDDRKICIFEVPNPFPTGFYF